MVRTRATAVLVAAVVTLLGYAAPAALGGSDADDGTILGPGIVTVPVDITYSVFEFDGPLRVRPGTLVQFEVYNHDPIPHELVVGPDEVHRAHEVGTELAHPPVPGEVSVAPFASGMTFYEFTEPGSVTYACHLPGHVAYGMIGEIEVVPGPDR